MKYDSPIDKHIQLRRISETKYFVFLILNSLVIISEIVFVLLTRLTDYKSIAVEIITFSLFLLIQIILYLKAKKDIEKYKILIENGVLLMGKVINITSSRGAGEVKMEAAYFDEQTGRSYYYKKDDWTIRDSLYFINENEKQNFLLRHPNVYILAEKDNMQKGEILIREYLDDLI